MSIFYARGGYYIDDMTDHIYFFFFAFIHPHDVIAGVWHDSVSQRSTFFPTCIGIVDRIAHYAADLYSVLLLLL